MSEYEVQLGVDVAEGGDQTVVAVRRDKRIEEMVVWTEPNLMASVEKIRAVADRYGVKPAWSYPAEYALGTEEHPAKGLIVVDAIGVGAGVASRLHELKYRVDPFRGNNAAPRPRSKYEMLHANMRAWAYFNFQKWIKDGGQLPPDRILDEETLAQTYDFVAGKAQIMDKKELRKTLGRSPDRLDAAVLSVWHDPHRVSYEYDPRFADLSW